MLSADVVVGIVFGLVACIISIASVWLQRGPATPIRTFISMLYYLHFPMAQTEGLRDAVGS